MGLFVDKVQKVATESAGDCESGDGLGNCRDECDAGICELKWVGRFAGGVWRDAGERDCVARYEMRVIC